MYEAITGLGQSVIIAPHGTVLDFYVEDGQAKQRPSMPITWALGKSKVLATGLDTCELLGVPAGATVKVDGEVSPFHLFGADTPGTYRVTVELWPYHTWVGTFTAE